MRTSLIVSLVVSLVSRARPADTAFDDERQHAHLGFEETRERRP
jgi:hypothetical protein